MTIGHDDATEMFNWHSKHGSIMFLRGTEADANAWLLVCFCSNIPTICSTGHLKWDTKKHKIIWIDQENCCRILQNKITIQYNICNLTMLLKWSFHIIWSFLFDFFLVVGSIKRWLDLWWWLCDYTALMVLAQMLVQRDNQFSCSNHSIFITSIIIVG